MSYKIILTLCLTLASASFANASTSSDTRLMKVDFTSAVSFFDTRSKYSQELLVKNTVIKDPAQRRGTENWEEPQGSFFVVPGVVLAVIAIALFFNRD